MRLIDADALKFKNVAEVNGILTHILTADEINNAPTIKPCLSLDNVTDEDIEKFKLIWQRATSKGLPLIAERPQGEWIYNDYGDGCGNWHCSVCDHMPYYATKYMRFLNFCPNCGADMRGGNT